jgi:hypothetical protein
MLKIDKCTSLLKFGGNYSIKFLTLVNPSLILELAAQPNEDALHR